LIEVVLALGVIAFALVGIMGLFPVALRSAQESQRETRATLIAQQIFSDLRVGTGTNRFVISGSNNATNTVNLAPSGTTPPLFLAFNTNGVPVTPATGISGGIFSNSYPDAAVPFLASLTVDTNTGITNLSRIQATIETPAAAPSTNRSKYTFVTLMNY
jgi:type II secretory pathway pseudopilin PulG